MSNLKIVLTQLQLLPESAVNRYVNGIMYPLRRAMLIEAGREVPNLDIIRTSKTLCDVLTDEVSVDRIHTLDSTALFVFQAEEKTGDVVKLRNEAKQVLMRRVANKQAVAPRSAAELNHMIDAEMQRSADQAAVNFGRAVDASQFIDTMSDDDGAYDESCLPDWVKEQVISKLVDAATLTYQDGKRRMMKAKFQFQETEPRAAMEGALSLLKHFDITEEDVLGYEAKATAETNALFARLDAEAQAAEAPAENETPKEKRARFRVQKAKDSGVIA